MVYRRGPEQMKASRYERELAQTNGVVIRYWARPVALEGHAGALSGVVFEDTHEREGALASPGSVFRIEADMLFTAIGQRGTPEALDGAAIEIKDGRIVVDAERRTSLERRLGRRRLRVRRPGSDRQRRRGRQAGGALDRRRARRIARQT